MRNKYPVAVRLFAKSLLVLFVMAGLAVPKSFSRTHEVGCDSAGECLAPAPFDLADLLPADDCPLGELPTDCGDCGHGEQGDDSHQEQDQDHQHDDGGHRDGSGCPHHHHHHQCVCIAANAWLISDTGSLSLHPPLQGHALIPALCQFVPEAPVYLLDRPPAV